MFNRFVSKFSVKGSRILMAQKPTLRLINFTQRNFFDYDNKDKNIFSSDEEETRQWDRKGRSQNSVPRETLDDTFFKVENNRHQGQYLVEEIPLYISKMRQELGEMKKKNRRERQQYLKSGESYFGKINGIISMHHQSYEQIKAQFPRFSSIFYEYLIFSNIKKHSSTFDKLEDHIVEVNIVNMPIPGIRNFLNAMLMARRGRKEILDKIVAHLDERNAYNDVKSNITIARILVALRAMTDDYLEKTLKSIQQEINMEIDNNTAKLGSGIVVYGGFHRNLIDIITRHLSLSDIQITAAEIKDFLSRHEQKEIDGQAFVRSNSKTSGLKDQILLAFYQYGLLQESRPVFYGDLIQLLYFNPETSKNRAILEGIPNLKSILEKGLQHFRDNLKDTKGRISTNVNASKLKNAMAEVGYFFKENERIIDVFKSDFYLPQENKVVEYVSINEMIKTADPRQDRLLTGMYQFKKNLIEQHGIEVVNIDFFDLIDVDGNHPDIVKLIKERVGEPANKKN